MLLLKEVCCWEDVAVWDCCSCTEDEAVWDCCTEDVLLMLLGSLTSDKSEGLGVPVASMSAEGLVKPGLGLWHLV